MKPRLAALAALFLLPLAVYLLSIRPSQLHWGATPTESAMPLPGDHLVASPSLLATRAITIAAPPERVWPWIVQLGYHRAGFYGYDLIENIGSTRGLPSLTTIQPDLQRLAPGHRVYMSGLAYFLVHQLDPPRTLVWASDESPVQGAFTFQLLPLDPHHTRLLVRTRIRYHWNGPLLPLDLFTEFGDPVAVPRMLQGIRDVAEGRPLPSLPLQALEITLWLLALAEFFLAARRLFTLPDWRRPWLAGLLAAAILLITWYARPPLLLPAVLLVAPIPLLRRTSPAIPCTIEA